MQQVVVMRGIRNLLFATMRPSSAGGHGKDADLICSVRLVQLLRAVFGTTLEPVYKPLRGTSYCCGRPPRVEDRTPIQLSRFCTIGVHLRRYPLPSHPCIFVRFSEFISCKNWFCCFLGKQTVVASLNFAICEILPANVTSMSVRLWTRFVQLIVHSVR